MCRTSLSFALLLLVTCTGAPVRAQGLPPDFQVTDLPPPAPKKVQPSLYDIFSSGTVSPLGTNVADVDLKDLFAEARSFYLGDSGHPANTEEAAFWLKRAILVGPDENGQQRALALARLGNLVYKSSSPTAHAEALPLFELAAAWNNADAIWILGQIAEFGDEASKPDLKAARLWYERAKKAGSTKAEASLAHLKSSP